MAEGLDHEDRESARKTRKIIVMKWYAIVIILVVILIVILADAGRLPGAITILYDFPEGDKVGHFLLMGLLSFLVAMSVSARLRLEAGRAILLVCLAVGLLVTLEEASQNFFVTRSASWGDLLSSYAGIAASGCLAGWLRSRRRAGQNFAEKQEE
jgi:hypothetical protein